jgi:hypothetical protein
MKPETLTALITVLHSEFGEDALLRELINRYPKFFEGRNKIPVPKVGSDALPIALNILKERESVLFTSQLDVIHQAQMGQIDCVGVQEAESFIDEIFGTLLSNPYFLSSIKTVCEESGDYLSREKVEEDFVARDELDRDYILKEEILDHVYLDTTGDGEAEVNVCIKVSDN